MSQIIEITSIECLGNDLSQIRDQLEQYAAIGILLSYNGKVIDADMLLQFYEYIMELNRKKLRKCQQKGIENALKRKSEGNGTYGRPRTPLPRDFEEQVCRYLKRKESLSNYCDKIGMKKSTFYKYAKRVQEKVKIEINMKNE